MKQEIKRNMPALGALQVIGKDAQGRKLIVPTYYHKELEQIINEKSNNTSILRRGFNKFKNAVVSFFNKNDYARLRKSTMRGITYQQCKNVTFQYMNDVTQRL